MAEQHVEAPEQVVTPGEELWVKIIDIDLERRRISLSIKQAAEGGEVAAEYREHFGEHAYDAQGNYIGTPITADDADREAAWAEYYNEYGGAPGDNAASPDDQQDADVVADVAAPVELPVEVAVEVPVEVDESE